MQAFILAGGYATRLWPLTERRAKPLLPLAGKPLLTRIVENIPQEIPVTVSTNAAFAEGFAAWKAGQRRPIILAVEHTTHDAEKPGALGAVAQWLHQAAIADDVLLLTGDNYFGFSMADFLGTYRQGIPLLAAHDIGDREKAKTFGVVTLRPADRTQPAGNSIAAFTEKPQRPNSTLVSTGCSILPKETLPILTAFAREHPDNIGGIFEELLRQDRHIDCYVFSEPWFDVGSYDAYIEATQALVPSGAPVIHPSARIDEESQRTCAGSVVIGAGTVVERSSLRDTILFENCRVADCTLERCIVDDACRLHGIDLTGKMLRSKTNISLP